MPRSGRTCTDCQGDLKRRSRAHLASKGTQNAVPGPTWPARATKTPFQGQLGAVRMPKTPFQVELDAVRMPKTPFQGELDVVRFPKWCAKAIKTLDSAEIIQNFCNCNTAAVPK